MNSCNCKKTFCDKKICGCRKKETQCSDTCSCDPESCKNRKLTEMPKEKGKEKPKVKDMPEEKRKEKSKVKEMPEEKRKAKPKVKEIPEEKGKEKPKVKEMPEEKGKEKPKVNEVPRKEEKEKAEEVEEVNVKMGQISLGDKEVLGKKEWKDFHRKLKECKGCGRKFKPERIMKHQKICCRRTFVIPFKKHNG